MDLFYIHIFCLLFCSHYNHCKKSFDCCCNHSLVFGHMMVVVDHMYHNPCYSYLNMDLVHTMIVDIWFCNCCHHADIFCCHHVEIVCHVCHDLCPFRRPLQLR